jgi:hypothetical protein
MVRYFLTSLSLAISLIVGEVLFKFLVSGVMTEKGQFTNSSFEKFGESIIQKD